MSLLQPNSDPGRGPPREPVASAPHAPDALHESPALPQIRRVRVSLGQTVITANAASALKDEDVLIALHRHSTGDWGHLCPEDRTANEGALVNGTRLLSSYRSKTGIAFWIITEADRSLTTVLLPVDY